MCTDDLQLNLLPEKTCLKSKRAIVYSLLQTFSILYSLEGVAEISQLILSAVCCPRVVRSATINFSSEPHNSHLLFRHTSKFSSRLGRVNENNVARSKNCCGWPSSPHERLVSYSLFTNTYTCKLGIFPYLENSYFSMFTKSEFSPS